MPVGFDNLTPTVQALRKNASLKALCDAIENDESSWFAANRYWHQRWLDGHSDSRTVEFKDRTGAIGCGLQTIRKQLERHARR